MEGCTLLSFRDNFVTYVDKYLLRMLDSVNWLLHNSYRHWLVLGSYTCVFVFGYHHRTLLDTKSMNPTWTIDHQ